MKKISILVSLLLSVGLSFSQVGINTATPLSTLDINGNMSVKVVNLTGNSTTVPTDISDGYYISITPTVNDAIFRLPSAITFPGRMYIIRNVSNTLTADLTSAGGQLFYKSTTGQVNGTNDIVYMNGTFPPAADKARSVIVISDGANWTVFN